VPLFLLSFFGATSFYEMHDFPERSVKLYRFFLKKMRGLVITNTWKRDRAKTVLGIPEEAMLVEQNAVSLQDFNVPIGKEEARKKLGLETTIPIVLYTGHLYGWKGVDTLALSAKQVPEAQFIFVGGREWDDLPAFCQKYKDTLNIRVTGHRPYQELALWQKAADILVLPNSGKEDISRFYTSPMKLFGYMASGRPIIASDLPSVREVVSDQAALFVPPDDPDALHGAIKKVLADIALQEKLARGALVEVQNHTWTARASRISSFIERRLVVG
jgi:glycosyltransferase involved in cell wall biosynthesis